MGISHGFSATGSHVYQNMSACPPGAGAYESGQGESPSWFSVFPDIAILGPYAQTPQVSNMYLISYMLYFILVLFFAFFLLLVWMISLESNIFGTDWNGNQPPVAMFLYIYDIYMCVYYINVYHFYTINTYI